MNNHNYNYHSHTYLCGHATGKPTAYVKEAIKHDYKNMGVTEHAPMSNLRNENSRLTKEDYPLYLELLEEAKDLAEENGINFYKGLEIEYFNHLDVYKEFLKDLDYLVLGQHYIIKDGAYKSTFKLDDIEDVILYRDLVLDALNSGYFNILAHPDLCFNNIKNPTDEMYELLRPIIKLAKELDIPLEFNANGIRKAKRKENCIDPSCYKYPRMKFFEMVKEEGAKVIISSDAHSPSDFHDYAIDKANELVKELGLNLVKELNMDYYKR